MGTFLFSGNRNVPNFLCGECAPQSEAISGRVATTHADSIFPVYVPHEACYNVKHGKRIGQ